MKTRCFFLQADQTWWYQTTAKGLEGHKKISQREPLYFEDFLDALEHSHGKPHAWLIVREADYALLSRSVGPLPSDEVSPARTTAKRRQGGFVF